MRRAVPARLRVLVRDAPSLALTVGELAHRPDVTTASGEPLSDHDPVAVDITWTKK